MRSSKMTLRISLLVLSAVLACGIRSGDAQLAVTTATLSGAVTDSSGAILPKATITLSSTEKGVTQTLVTDSRGRYSFSQLPPATYILIVQMTGFKEYRQNGIVLDAGQSATQDVKLPVGSVTQVVEVTAQASLLNTDNANISADIDAKQVVDLPLNLRNVYGLALLNSAVNNGPEMQMVLGGGGASNDDADQDVSFFHFNGGFMGTSAFLLDGVWDTDPEWGGVSIVPSVDAVQEFKIQNNSFTAQYGWSTGNVINVVTKSGTNSFHGSAYYFYRNDILDANLWFSNHYGVPRESFGRKQFGASAGGPLSIPGFRRQHEKTFIFGLYEHLGLSTPSHSVFTVPDSNFLAGHFAELLGPQMATDAEGRPVYLNQIYDPRSTHPITAGVLDPTTGLVPNQTGYIRNPIPNNDITTLGAFDPVAAKIASYYPTANQPGIANNFAAVGLNPAHSNEYLVRVDHNINDASHAYFRYSYKEEFKTGNPAYWGANDPGGPGAGIIDNRFGVAAGYSQIFSPTLTMNIMAGVELWHEDENSQGVPFQSSSLGLPSQLDSLIPQFPTVNIGGLSSIAPAVVYQVDHGPEGSVAVDFIKVNGQHTLNFGFMGVELEEDNKMLYQTSLQFNGSFDSGPDPNNPLSFPTGNGFAQLLLGVQDGGVSGAEGYPATASHNFGWYVQDDWKPARNLTLNLGLRYEIQTAPTYKHDKAAVFNPNVLNPISSSVGEQLYGAEQFLSSSNRSSYNTNYKNVAPRVGFSYEALSRLVVRGGFGIFYPVSIGLFQADLNGYTSFTPVPYTLNGISPNSAVSMENPWPNGFIPITGSSLGELQDVGYATGSNFRNRASGYTEQYMLGLQWGITANDSLEVDYVGNHGTHLMTAATNASQLNPKYLSMGISALNTLVPNPFYGAIAPGASGCALDQPTIVQSQLLQPFPQYCSVTAIAPPVGFTQYNALQVHYNHRVTRGLTAMVSYTYSKFLDNIEGNITWAYYNLIGNQGPANNYNLAAEKSVDASDIPHSLVANYIYELPFGRGKPIGSGMGRLANAVAGGWQVSQIATFKQGFPLGITGYNQPTWGGNPRPDVLPSVNLHVSHPTILEWFNTGAYAYAPYGSFGTAPRFFSNLRAPGYQNWDTAFMKNWEFGKSAREPMRLQFRGEMYNTFNHPQFYAPSTIYGGCDPNTDSGCTPGFGQITAALPGRTVQLAAKFYW
jgi:hypothetical protein